MDMKPTSKTCEEFRPLLGVYDTLDGSTRQALDSHLVECTACRQALAEERALNRLMQGWSAQPAMPDHAAALTHKVMDQIAHRQVRVNAGSWSWVYRWTPAALSMALLLVFVMEWARLPELPAANRAEPVNGVQLNGTQFRHAAAGKRNRKTSMDCRSPFANAAQKLNCLKEKYQLN